MFVGRESVTDNIPQALEEENEFLTALFILKIDFQKAYYNIDKKARKTQSK